MDTSLVSSEAVDLLSRITGQKLSQRDLTPPVIFLANLVTLLLGVIYADGTVTDDEKQRLLTTLNRFIPTEGGVRRLAHLMIKGVKENLDNTKPSQLSRLAAPLSKSQRLLLISFGYEISAADGVMDTREKRYLEIIGDRLSINPQHLAVLEAVFSRQGPVDPAALDEVQSLLDPSRFHELDTVFVNAASEILAALPDKPEQPATQQQPATFNAASNASPPPPPKVEHQRNKHHYTAYEQLQQFQKNRQQLDNFCYQLYQTIQDCTKHERLPNTLEKELGKVSQKLQSQRFRISVVGEFSQGKSTFLNALLGEEIQPARAIPCSGAVTILKYGKKMQVVCRYKDGRSEEIPLDQYKVKAAIPKEAARDHRSEQLGQSDIDEIIFEHPDLDLCRNGVEIIDSPGLNEHPDRTAITQKLLKDTDAAIFLTNAMRLLPEKEKELIQDVRTQLNGGKENEPADNLFVLVNFMDLLDEEEDRQDVSQRIESFVKQQNLLIKTEDRIHYISAKSALKAILKGADDEYLKTFQSFTQSIEQFLTHERGFLKIKKSVIRIQELNQAGLDGLHQAEKVLLGKLTLSEAKKQEILEQIGEASGRDLRIRLIADEIKDASFEEANESLQEWLEELGERLANKVEHWSSKYNPIFDQQRVIEDYVNQFLRDIQQEIDTWGNKELKEKILKPHFEILENSIKEELDTLQKSLLLLDKDINTDFSKQINLAINGIEGSFGDFYTYISGGLFGGGLGAGLLILLGLGGPIMWAVAGVGAAIAGALGFGMGGIHDQIKLKVFETGCEKFVEATEKLTDKIGETIDLVFNTRVEEAIKVIEQAIFLCENLLEQQEKIHNETLEQRQIKKAFIVQKRGEFEQLQKNIEAFLPY
ncbi:dynamin family protein [Coleofasciculus sp. FACHB-542]|uniref:dynamin family protein n=1 Tax=Coleofasciculus sp. FACHB-542 TaxID=2692787 RepID=UPI00168A1E39|nr:dynamin family protein [Coleofasciculus sp. FACHB-542]MBD2083622.1 dynamin family protein [Coleofasciculus sp. FACHB-542]